METYSSFSRSCNKATFVFFLACFLLTVPSALHAATYAQWAASEGLTGADAAPTANPDGDPYINVLEFAFATDPEHADSIENVGPWLTVVSNALTFIYRVSTQAQGVSYRLVQATNLDSPDWTDVPGEPVIVPATTNYSLYYQPLDVSGPHLFFRLEVTLALTSGFQVVVLVGTDIGSGYWNGLPVISQVYVRRQAPDISVVTTNQGVILTNTFPNVTKYPEVVGTSLTAATPELQDEFAFSDHLLRRRSWMGWFLWGNGTPPPGLSPGYPVTGIYDTNSNWDFFSYQFPAKSTNQAVDGAWKPIRLDQQPLYLNPFRINYAWPPGQFGYQSQPLLPFSQQTGYWAQKRIVRGPNLSFPNPFFVQYADKITTGDTPDVWRDSWFFMRTRPLETLLVLPGNLTPNELLQNGPWNNTGTNNDPYPYPVWNTNFPPADQTPFALQVHRMGDWDADLIWEGTQPQANGYSTNHYGRTTFSQPPQGNYLKMTVAQGSPFIWCETANNRYVNFYNLIRQNLTNTIASNFGTAAAMVPGGPWAVPGVTDVKYVLFYGDHNNPNQWYHETAPWFYDAVKSLPGGFNPPGAQHNHTYIALFYRDSAVQTVTLGAGGQGATENNGTDAQGNPYFYLEFKNTAKNWFVVGAVPVMSYYHTGVTVDSEPDRIAGARSWAEGLGKYAFNFLTGTKISYSSDNMALVTTTYSNSLSNPYLAAGDATAANMTANPSQTVMALLPHQYQPLTLGPDLTRASRPEVVWNPLKQYDQDFPVSNAPPNADKNNPASTSRWGYWGPRGTMKTIISGAFVTQYPFQNFLPVMPPPNLHTNYPQTGIQVVRITDVGSGYHAIANPKPAATIHTAPGTNGSGAAFDVLLEPFTGRVLQVNVVSGGSGYPDGNPPDTNLVWLTIDPPQIPSANGGRQASARLQIGGGKVLAVFMNDKGAGYESTISVTQSNVSYDPPIIVPPYDAAGNLALGEATIISGGAGFNFGDTNNPPVVKVIGTGTGAVAQIAQAGQIVGVAPGSAGGFTVKGNYPSSGNPATDMARVRVTIPPPAPGLPAQTAQVSKVLENPAGWGGTAMINQGQYATQPTAHFIDDNGATINCLVNFGGGRVINVTPTGAFKILTPKDVTFVGGNPTVPAQAKVYSLFTVEEVQLTPPLVGGYQGDIQVSFSGGEIPPPGVILPTIGFTIATNGTITNLHILSAGSGIAAPGHARIIGGKGYDAMISPVIDTQGHILAVKVLRTGSDYPTNVFTTIDGAPGTGAELAVVVQDRQVTAVNVIAQGSGYPQSTTIFLTSVENGPPDVSPAKGSAAGFNFGVDGLGHVTVVIPDANPLGANYVPGSEGKDIPESPAAQVVFDPPFVAAVPAAVAQRFVAQVIHPNLSVDQVLYDNIISQYKVLASADLKPFGGGFGGSSGPDGYGLGNGLSAAAKFIGVLYNFEQYFAAQGMDQPDVSPSTFAFNDGSAAESVYELPIYRANQPMLTLSGGLQTSVQALQRTLTLLHQDPPYHNNPQPSDWQMDYFSFYDHNAGRLVINPSGTIPVQGVVSRIINPPSISEAENSPKVGLNRWQPGMLWSGFGVSDQWNDQHYFYGYYLGTAGLLSVLDGSWQTNIVGKPSKVWADPGQMGTAVDQWLMTLAYDPDNLPLVNSLYRQPGFAYQKFAFFDQWNGHAWATGVSPGRAGDVEDGRFGALVPWSIWLSHGTGTGPYDDENENSIWEGLQAWSAILLWGGGTDRKAVVDLGMYLLATGNAAGDLYFHDKNYNLPNTASNKFSWVPVTTVNSSAVAGNGGNNNTPANTGFVETTAPAFYTAPEAFGGAGSAGTSILHKGSPSLNNFFYAFPTGSKFIQSFPAAQWTLGISRNSDYMKRWAGSMMRQEWQDARNSSLYQPANWLSMAMATALCGVPYNPGDLPYPLTGASANANAPDPYVGRLWSSWVTLNAPAGAQAAKQPAFTQIEVLTFLHTLDTYGTADWTYIARATDATGGPDNTAIVFTATFSKLIAPSAVRTTFAAFNPGWQNRHATFYRIAPDGTIGTSPVTPEMPLTIAPKRLMLLTKDFPIN